MKIKQEKPSKFLVKLLNILRSKQHAKVISWDCENQGIKIHNHQKLQSHLLPRYFRHNRFSSFVRQLNMYDFHKFNLEDGTSIFFHDSFNPREYSKLDLSKDSIINIRRKTTEKEETPADNQIKDDIQNHNGSGISVIKPIQPRQSFQLLFPKASLNSFNSINKMSVKQLNPEQVLDEILSQMQSLATLSPNTIKDKINQLKKIKKFRKFLKRGSFLSTLYAKMGIQMDEDDKLSELSIEEELMYGTNTGKQLALNSFKMFESGTFNLRDTLGMFLN